MKVPPMRRITSLVVIAAATAAVSVAPAAATSPDTTTQLSRDGLSGATSNAESAYTAYLSGDGSRALFITQATNLGGAAGTTTQSKMYLRDVRTGSMTLVGGPEGAPGTAANGSVSEAELSDDGRWVAYRSDSTNLVPGFVNGNANNTDVFLTDTQTGAVTLVSHSTAGPLAGANASSDNPSISADGRYVAYTSTATNLISPFTDNDGVGAYDVFVYDRVTGTTTLISRSQGSATATANGESLFAAISPDGRYVAIESGATDLVPGFANNNAGGNDVFLAERGTPVFQLLSHTPGGPLNGGNGGSNLGYAVEGVARGARAVSFSSVATNLVAGFSDGNAGGGDIFLWDRGHDSTSLVSHAAGNSLLSANASSSANAPSLSADGSYLTFSSVATNLVAGESVTGGVKLYGHDVASGETTLLAHTAGAPTSATGQSCCASLSADGRLAAYVATSTDLFSGFVDGNGASPGDTFLNDRTGSPAPRSLTPPSVSGTISPGETLTCLPGSWTEDPTFAISWQRSGSEVATGATYTLSAADVSQPVRCLVSASTYGGTTVAASDAVTVPAVQVGPPGPTGPPGASAPLAFALSAKRFEAELDKKLKIPFVVTQGAELTATAKRKHAKKVKVSESVKAGRGTLNLKLHETGTWKLTVIVKADGGTSKDSAKIKVS
jgi:Tol biopolymer transport system component